MTEQEQYNQLRKELIIKYDNSDIYSDRLKNRIKDIETIKTYMNVFFDEFGKSFKVMWEFLELVLDNLAKDYEMYQKNELKKSDKEITRDLIFLYFPNFKEHYEKLKNAYVFIETETGLNWNYSKQSLAEYFGNQKKDNESINWKYIERLFTIKNQEITGLKDSFYQYRNIYQKESKDYESIQKIIDN